MSKSPMRTPLPVALTRQVMRNPAVAIAVFAALLVTVCAACVASCGGEEKQWHEVWRFEGELGNRGLFLSEPFSVESSPQRVEIDVQKNPDGYLEGIAVSIESGAFGDSVAPDKERIFESDQPGHGERELDLAPGEYQITVSGGSGTPFSVRVLELTVPAR
ncbi:MAG TPA: hypothetical protein VLQ52_06025 [Coriobacteriia bacterium]|nr:hypothetical protein [Coriobacteriia bacterium]